MMNIKKSITALVPMRHHSQRVVGKNYRPLSGRPLYEYIIQTLLNCPEIDAVVVDTDSQPIIDGLEKNFPQVQILKRPEHLRRDDVPMNEVLAHDVSQVKSDLYLQTHSTNPLLSSQTISRAIHALIENYPAYDSLFSVTRIKTRLWDQLGRAINHNPKILLQTQDLPPIYEENSCIYIFSAESLLANHNRLGERPLMFEINPPEAWDIDNELDFQIVEFLVGQRSMLKG
jgi:CMP-N-acetylneuraminic acid synthetase